MRITAASVAAATGGSLVSGSPDAVFTSFHTDSREVPAAGGLFFALRGAETDGHRFVTAASRRGSVGVVVQADVEVAPGTVVIRVADSWRALYDLAASVLARAAPLCVGVTGSNGKTSTKEMVAAALACRYTVLRTQGNLNTETGVPLTVLNLEPGHHTAIVLEMGMQGPGEIARLAALARPQIGVITGIGTVHIEFFENQEGIARAKGELLEALPASGLAVINADDAFEPLLRSLSRAPVVTFGLEAGDYRAEAYAADPAGGSHFSIRGAGVRLGINGGHQVRNALAALAVAEHAGVPLDEAAPALASVRVPGRLAEHATPAGFTVIDDAYNASPESMLAAFEAVAERPRGGGRFAVLGEMRELGVHALEAHQRVGRRAAEVFDSVAVVDVGHGPVMAAAAGAELLPDREAAVAWARRMAGPGATVLVKASHGVHLETVVEALLTGAGPGGAG